VYRLIPVDGASKYVITVHSHAPVPIQYSFLVYDSFVGEDGRQAHLDTPVAGLRDRDIKVGADGSFTLTVDGTPAIDQRATAYAHRYAPEAALRHDTNQVGHFPDPAQRHGHVYRRV